MLPSLDVDLRTCSVWLLTIAALFITACEENVAPPSEMKEPFSMYGVFNPRRTVQTIAVAPIQPLMSDYPQSIDAVVTSTDLQTGKVLTWTDSVVTGRRGQRDHVFWAEWMPVRGRDYLVEARRSDGAVSSAIARVPAQVEVEYMSNPPRFLDVFVNGENFRLVKIDVEYLAHWTSVLSANVCRNPLRVYSVSYTNREIPTAKGYHVRVNPASDHVRLVDKYAMNWIKGFMGMALSGLRIRILVGDPAWKPPGLVFDEHLLGMAGMMSNVRNGFGLVTGGYEYQERIFPSAQIIESTDFWDFMLRPPAECLNYCQCN